MKTLSKGMVPYLFLSPWIAGFLLFTVGPLVFSVVMSFHSWPVTGDAAFIGVKNYVQMFTQDKQFWASLGITFEFALLFVPLNLVLALVLAVLLTQKVRGVNTFRNIFYLPAVVSGVAVSIIWGWIFNSDYGILNYGLSLVGIEGPRWLADPAWAIFAVVIASAWGVGTMMLIFYTDIRGVAPDVYEAATIDGAGPFRQFFQITIPIITPTILFNVITSTITAMQQLTLVLLLTKGGPVKSTYFYGMYVYSNAFKFHELGYASANAWLMFLLILGLTAFIFKTSSSWVFYEAEGGTGKGGRK
jgi:multiple sugar transport system permease protein